MSLLSDLATPPNKLSPASRFTAACGVFYAANGLALVVWPGMLQALFRDPAFAGHEGAMVRVIGMLLAALGAYYFFGGRSGSRPFVAATIVNRLTLVPAVLLYTAASGVFPHVMLTFAVLDPVLAVVAWRLLSRETRYSANA